MWISEAERNYQAGQDARWAAIKSKGKREKKPKESKRLKRRLKQRLEHERTVSDRRCRKYLVKFWECFNNLSETHDKLNALKMAANPPWERVSIALRMALRKKYEAHRGKFLAGDIPECIVCGSEKANEKHHIVPLSFGGINDNCNMIKLGYNCHEEIHPWLKK